MSALVYINGQFFPKLDARISIYDHGLLYGDGVWEGLRLHNGQIPFLDDHLRQLFQAAETLALPMPHSPAELAEIIRLSVARNSRQQGYVRVIVTRGPGTIGLDPRKCDAQVVVMVDEVVPFPSEVAESGVHLAVAGSVRHDPALPTHRVRSLSQGHLVLAKVEALRQGCLDAVLLTPGGQVAGTTEGVLLAVQEGQLVTPPPEQSVPADVLADALCHRHHATRRPLGLEDLLQAEEVCLVSVAVGVVPVLRIDSQEIGSNPPGPSTLSLRTSLKDLLS